MSFILLIMLSGLLLVPATAGAITEKNLPDAFTDVISKLSSLGDRSTGTAGNQEAALYIKEKFEQLGYENLGAYRFSTPVMRRPSSRYSDGFFSGRLSASGTGREAAASASSP